MASVPRSAALVLAATFVLMGPRPASGEPGDARSRAQSRTHFTTGVREMQDGRPADALRAFRQAYALYPHASTLYNMALCQRSLGKHAEALETLRRFLAEGMESASPDQKASAVKLAHEAEARVTIVTIKTRPVAAVRIDGKLVEGDEAILEPGTHKVEASAAGYQSARQELSATAGSRPTVELTLVPDDPPVAAPAPASPAMAAAEAEVAPPEPTASSPLSQRLTRPFWYAAGTAAGLLTLGTITGIVALSDRSSYRDPSISDAEAEDFKSRGETLRLVADVSFALGAVATVVAVVLVVRPVPGRPAARVTVAPAPGGGWLRVQF